MLEYLYSELLRRSQQKVIAPHLVIMVYCCTSLKNHPLSKFINKASTLGVSFFFFENYREFIPQYCTEIVRLSDMAGEGTILSVDGCNREQNFNYRSLSDESAARLALKLAPVYCEEISLEGTLTKNITFFDMMGIFTVDDLDLQRNWSSAQIYKTMAAPIGVKTQNELVYLDLHEKAHGPHGLVAGTTGSGKSEALQSYILSMAIAYHPYEVGFVIIDFKGGGMANQFEKLPHLIGTITNIDGREIERSLKSIKAELQKRQRVFAEAGVNNIGNYIRKFKSGEASLPLPHLIIIVDEFAELKAEQPEFMKELISAARIGRSLGVHLILATQKPSGQVNEQIWSNSRFKICLKVQDAQDSNEVLKSPLAAEIKEPGRAYLQVGNNELFELFQSAYSGAPAVVSDTGAQKEYDISVVSQSGRRQPMFSQKKNKTESGLDSQNQLQAVVEYTRRYCEQNGIAHLPPICLPSLHERILFQKQETVDPIRTILTIGVYDDPDRQYQGLAELDLSTGNTFIIGSAQMGKTNVLQTIVKAAAENYSPQELTMYIIDFNSMILKNFDNLAHVGGVVTASEDEALKNLFKILNSEIVKRKEKLLEVGVSSFTSYREAGQRDLPQILLLIDNLTALRELYLEDNDVLLGVCRDGPTVGITVVVTNSQTAGVGYRYLSSFPNRMALYCNDSGEYSMLFDHSRMRPAGNPGRCVIEIDKAQYECQTYLAFEGEKEIERVTAMREFVQQINARYVGQSAAVEIPVIPKVLTEEILASRFPQRLKPYHVIVGLDYASVEPVVFDVTQLGLLAMSGKPKMGRGNFLRYLLTTLEKDKERAPVSVCIADDMRQRLAPLQALDIVTEYTLAADKVIETIALWDQELKRRYDLLMSGDVEAIQTAPLLLLIIQNSDMAAEISNNRDCIAQYKNFFSKYKAMKVAVIFSNLENASIPYGAPEAIKPLRESHHFLFFDDLPKMRLFDLPISVVKQYRKETETGDCFLTSESGVVKLKSVLCDESE